MSEVPLSARDTKFYNKVIENEEAEGWKGVTRRKVNTGYLRQIFGSFDYLGLEKEVSVVAFGQSLKALERAGKITLGAQTDREKIPLPIFVWLEPTAERQTKVLVAPPLHKKLLPRIDKPWSQLGAKQRKFFLALSCWLQLERDSCPFRVPFQERSLEIMSLLTEAELSSPEEKFFDGKWTPGFWLKERDDFFDFLSMRDVTPPLSDQGFYPLGPGKVMLVVENIATAWSIRKSLPAGHALGSLVWGRGYEFKSSVMSMTTRKDINEILYFGDIDKDGLQIPRLNKFAEKLGICKPRPAFELYSALLERGKPSTVKVVPMLYSTALECTSWLPESHQKHAVELMMKGQRLAQEWVGYEYLKSHTHWYSDVC